MGNRYVRWPILAWVSILLLVIKLPAFGYHWPLIDFDKQHFVRSTLNECRGDRDHFHNGIDIDATQGTLVYTVQSGYVTHPLQYPYDVIFIGGFEYRHLYIEHPEWYPMGTYFDDKVWIAPTNNRNHLHFADGPYSPGGSAINPLSFGRISPFSDDADPTVDEIYLLRNDNENSRVDPNNVSGLVDIVVQAHDFITEGGSNAGIYRIAWGIDSNPAFFNYQFDWWYTSDKITRIYAPGSGTSTFKYKVTNCENSDGYWDSRTVNNGWHTIWVYPEDIRYNYASGSLTIYVNNITQVEESEPIQITPKFELWQSCPNPFIELTAINYQLPVKARVTLNIYNITGQLVKRLVDEIKEPGYYKVNWDGRSSAGQEVQNGVYLYRFEAGDFKMTRKVIKIR